MTLGSGGGGGRDGKTAGARRQEGIKSSWSGRRGYGRGVARRPGGGDRSGHSETRRCEELRCSAKFPVGESEVGDNG
jgi:hypothetical protein